ncbi:MAG: AIR synthase-related protein, partial [Microcoleaceae cyanobacterium]
GWQTSGDLIYLHGYGERPIEKVVEADLEGEEVEEMPQAEELPQILTLNASEYLAVIHNVVAGKPPRVDFDLERRVQAVCRNGIRQRWIKSAHDCAEGGLAIALAECCISGQKGATVNFNVITQVQPRWDRILFGEGGARIVVSVSPDHQEAWEAFLQENLPEQAWYHLGQVEEPQMGLKLVAGGNDVLIEANLIEISDCHANAIERRLQVG